MNEVAASVALMTMAANCFFIRHLSVWGAALCDRMRPNWAEKMQLNNFSALKAACSTLLLNNGGW